MLSAGSLVSPYTGNPKKNNPTRGPGGKSGGEQTHYPARAFRQVERGASAMNMVHSNTFVKNHSFHLNSTALSLSTCWVEGWREGEVSSGGAKRGRWRSAATGPRSLHGESVPFKPGRASPRPVVR